MEFSTCGIGIVSAQVTDFECLETWDPAPMQERAFHFLGHETLELEVESGRLRAVASAAWKVVLQLHREEQHKEGGREEREEQGEHRDSDRRRQKPSPDP